MISPALHAAYATVSDDDLAAAASRGLLRRALADVEAGHGAVDPKDADSFVFVVDGHTATLTPAGLVRATCSCPSPGVCRHRLSAVLALRQVLADHPAPEATPEPPPQPKPAAPKAKSPPRPKNDPDTEPLDALTGAISDLLERFFVAGLAAIPPSANADLLAHATRVRRQVPRLSGVLHDIAAGLDKARRRAPSHKAGDLLADIATAAALCAAVKANGGAPPPALAIPDDSTSPDALNLIGLGARTWTSSTQAHGVTGYFLHPPTTTVYSATIARASGHDLRFDPHTAYQTERVWGANLARLSTACFTLRAPKPTAHNRLAIAQGGLAEDILPWNGVTDRAAFAAVTFSNWHHLSEWLSDAMALRRSLHPSGTTVAVLVPSAFGVPGLDETSQILHWPLLDADGRRLRVPLQARGLFRCPDSLLAHIMESVRPWGVVVEAKAVNGALTLTPIAVIADKLMALEFHAFWQIKAPADPPGPSHSAPNGEHTYRPVTVDAPPATATLIDAAHISILEIAEQGAAFSADAQKRVASTLAAQFAEAELAPIAMLLRRAQEADAKTLPAMWLRVVHALNTVKRLRLRLHYD